MNQNRAPHRHLAPEALPSLDGWPFCGIQGGARLLKVDDARRLKRCGVEAITRIEFFERGRVDHVRLNAARNTDRSPPLRMCNSMVLFPPLASVVQKNHSIS